MTDEEILHRIGGVRYHIATNQWSLIAPNGNVKTLTSHKMRMHIQRIVKAGVRSALAHEDVRERAWEVMALIRASQRPQKERA